MLHSVLSPVILILQTQNSIFKKNISNKSHIFPNIALFSFPLHTASTFISLTTFLPYHFKLTSLLTNNGQTGADFHSGTFTFLLSIISNYFVIDLDGGTTQLTLLTIPVEMRQLKIYTYTTSLIDQSSQLLIQVWLYFSTIKSLRTS